MKDTLAWYVQLESVNDVRVSRQRDPEDVWRALTHDDVTNGRRILAVYVNIAIQLETGREMRSDRQKMMISQERGRICDKVANKNKPFFSTGQSHHANMTYFLLVYTSWLMCHIQACKHTDTYWLWQTSTLFFVTNEIPKPLRQILWKLLLIWSLTT